MEMDLDFGFFSGGDGAGRGDVTVSVAFVEPYRAIICRYR